MKIINLVLISFWDVVFNQGKPAKHTHRSTLWLFLVENSFFKMKHIHNLIVSIKQSKNQPYKLRWEFRSCCLGEGVFLLEEASRLLLGFTFRICNLESSRRQFSISLSTCCILCLWLCLNTQGKLSLFHHQQNSAGALIFLLLLIALLTSNTAHRKEVLTWNHLTHGSNLQMLESKAADTADMLIIKFYLPWGELILWLRLS